MPLHDFHSWHQVGHVAMPKGLHLLLLRTIGAFDQPRFHLELAIKLVCVYACMCGLCMSM